MPITNIENINSTIGQGSVWVRCKNGSPFYRWNSDYISVAMGSAYPRHSGHWKRKPIVIEGKECSCTGIYNVYRTGFFCINFSYVT